MTYSKLNVYKSCFLHLISNAMVYVFPNPGQNDPGQNVPGQNSFKRGHFDGAIFTHVANIGPFSPITFKRLEH